MRQKLGGFLTVGILFLLMACSSGDASSSPENGATVDVSPVSTPLVASADATVSVLPTPTTSSVEALPDSDEVIIRGRLVLTDPLNTAPEDDGIYLIPIQADGAADVSFAVPEIDDTSYQAAVDVATGDFTISGVPVGFYALVVRTVDNRQLSVRDMATAQSMFVTVMENHVGSVLELGDLRLP